jgi:hypothetical protein
MLTGKFPDRRLPSCRDCGVPGWGPRLPSAYEEGAICEGHTAPSPAVWCLKSEPSGYVLISDLQLDNS